jgi:hypothetical protein
MPITKMKTENMQTSTNGFAIQFQKESTTMAMTTNPNSAENTPPYEQVDGDKLRAEAEKRGTSDPKLHAQHDRQLAELDRRHGPTKGGR